MRLAELKSLCCNSIKYMLSVLLNAVADIYWEAFPCKQRVLKTGKQEPLSIAVYLYQQVRAVELKLALVMLQPQLNPALPEIHGLGTTQVWYPHPSNYSP